MSGGSRNRGPTVGGLPEETCSSEGLDRWLKGTFYRHTTWGDEVANPGGRRGWHIGHHHGRPVARGDMACESNLLSECGREH
jgi:hypothetical protein